MLYYQYYPVRHPHLFLNAIRFSFFSLAKDGKDPNVNANRLKPNNPLFLKLADLIKDQSLSHNAW